MTADRLAPDDCLDENGVAALLEGTLSEGQRAAAEAHADGCAACRRLIAAAAMADDEGSIASGSPSPSPSPAPGVAGAAGSADPRRGVAEADAERDERFWTMPLTRGVAVGRFVILDRIGAGGMASVFSAWDPELDRKVALKFLHPHLAALEALIRTEAQAMARLSHPNVVAVYDVGRFGDRLFVAMEYVEGVTLREHLRSKKPGWREVLALFRQAGQGLQAAHDAGVVHGDFKPQNVLVRRDGRVLVGDFGLARSQPAARPLDGLLAGTSPLGRSPSPHLSPLPARSPASPPSPGAPLIPASPVPPASPLSASPLSASPVSASPGTPPSPASAASPGSPGRSQPPLGAGTPAYMAPEQLDGGPLDARADVFAFCASLYEALYGVLPFEGKSPRQIAEAVRAGRVRPAPPSRVQGFIHRAVVAGLLPAAAERPASIDAVLHALAAGDARKRLLRRVAIAAAGVGAVAAIAVARDPLRACRDSPRRLAGIWDDARRREIHDAFARTGLAYADDAWRRVSDELVAFAGAWARGYAAACEESVRRGETDPGAYLRMACLAEQLAEARAKSDLFARADAKMVGDAAAMAAALPEPAECTRPVAVALSPEQRLRPAIERVRERIARARSLDEAAQYPEALSLSRQALAEARAIGWPPLLAQALLQLGETQASVDDMRAGLGSINEAAATAEAAQQHELAARAHIASARILGDPMTRYEDAQAELRHARLSIERAAGDDALRAHLENAVGITELRAGHIEAALAAHRAARALYEKTGRVDRFLTWLINDEAIALYMLGRGEEAAEKLVRAVEVKERVLGPRHPDVGISISNLGSVLISLRRYDEAQPALLKAEKILADTLPPEALPVVALETNVGDLLLARGELAAALARYQRAIASEERSGRVGHQNRRLALMGLGRTLLALGRSEEAVAQLERALPEEGQPVDVTDLADLRFVLARALVAAGRDRDRALELAAKARDAYVSLGRRGTATVSEIDAWLAPLHRGG